MIEPSPSRVEPRCPHYGICGGCSLQHLSPGAQILFKQEMVTEALGREGLIPKEMLPPLKPDSPWGYRNKARLGVRYVEKKRKALVGFRERGTSFVTDLSGCDVLHPAVGRMIQPLADLVTSLSIRERIPQIEVSIGDSRCVLVLRILEAPSTSDIHRIQDFADQWDIAFFLQEGGPDTLRPLAGDGTRLSYGIPEFDVNIAFSPNDFTQVNGTLNLMLISRVAELLDPNPDDSLLDLFCGAGNFTLPLARSAGRITGVDGEPALLDAARFNTARNRISNARFFHTDLFSGLESEPWARETFNKVLLDPPRNGAEPVLPYLPQVGAEVVVYVSCFPDSFARDAGTLVHRLGYRLRSLGIVDMFPHTTHVESIAVFDRPTPE